MFDDGSGVHKTSKQNIINNFNITDLTIKLFRAYGYLEYYAVTSYDSKQHYYY